MVRGKYATTDSEIAIATGMRRYILAEELGTTLPIDHSPANMELLIYNDTDVPVGCGYVGLNDDFDFVIGGIAILPAYRNQKYGTFLVKILIDKALMSHAPCIYLDALKGTEGFFETLGFTISSPNYDKQGTTFTPMQLDPSTMHKCCCHENS